MPAHRVTTTNPTTDTTRVTPLRLTPTTLTARPPSASPPSASPPQRPAWPHPHRVKLTAHPNGQWVKKHRGKLYYFGPIDDPDSALERWEQSWPSIVAGQPSPSSGVPVHRIRTVVQACNAWLDAQQLRAGAGHIRESTFNTRRNACRVFTRAVGRHTSLAALRPDDFTRYQTTLTHKGYTPQTQALHINVIRTLLAWLTDCGVVVARPPRDFRPPSRKVMRRHKRSRRLDFSRPQVRHLIATAQAHDRPELHAMLLLGINCGMQGDDIFRLRTSDLVTDPSRPAAWRIDTYRHKTETLRRAPLWPETSAALQRLWPERSALPTPEAPRSRGALVFARSSESTTPEQMAERLTWQFQRFRRDVCGLETGGFSWLRKTFATQAKALSDDNAAKLIMGHVIDGIHEGYVQEWPWSRMESITEHVRGWLYGSVSAGAPPLQPRVSPGH